MTDPPEITGRILARCRELGFALAGVCEAAPTRFEHELRRWLAAGRHGDMAYLQRHVEVMLDPRTLLPGARSIICVADRYDGTTPEHTPAERPKPPCSEPALGRVARYARGDDYHIVMKRRLHSLGDALRREHPDERFRVCVDTAPLPEREHAQRAGLGAVGKHTLLIEPGVGSWLLLGEIITTLALRPGESKISLDPCGSCTRCIDACPTGAITPWSVDATKCISYLTIEHRSAIDARFHGSIGDWVFGCDICQEVCPHNQPTQRTRAAPTHPAYSPRHDAFDLLEVLGWDEAARRAAFTRSALKRATLAMMKRNAILVAGERLARGEAPALRRPLEQLAASPDETAVVRETALAVLRRLAGPSRAGAG
jgi:epoxyqueuosine reductase